MSPVRITNGPQGFEYYKVCDPSGICRVARGWEGMEPIDNDDFGGLYRLQYTPGNFVPEVTVARQGDLFQKQCFLEADSPLPAVRLPQSGW
mgnify:CR=1 FL=1|tara:strand:+ start:83 stop:355 length:273 start_codon:yes stop_codon:yes gene_type:complete